MLLVEGRTELRTIAQFLKLYGKEHEVLLLPLHGDVMINERRALGDAAKAFGP